MTLGGYRIGPLLRKTAREIGSDHVTSLAASAAYNFFFSLFPLLLFLAPLLSLVGNKQRMVDFLMARLTSVMPPSQLDAIRPALENIVFTDSAPGLLSAGLLLAAWSGSTVFGSLIGSLNTAFDVEETRPWVRQQLIRLGTFALSAVILILTTVIFLGGEDIANTVGGWLRLGDAFVTAWKFIQFPLAVVGLFGLAFVMIYFLPNIRQRKSHAMVGATVTTLLWLLATLLFRLYVQHFPPNPAYGFLGGVIVLLMWMYYTMFVMLAGGELASELHHGTGAIEPRKGAVYHGRIVNGE
ncbi:MAG TPA: YihY/virulence factor BrkB family protein [Gemmatimonadaceae bacterium]|nr:YihY/virulence factor BrkB family protein [Gemmatimonadaceae bacterium]